MSNSPAVPTYKTPSRSDDPTWDRLEDELAWYDRRSVQNQRTYKRIKITEIIAAGAIPFLSALNISQGSAGWSHYVSWVIGGLGVLITILEGMLQLNQYQQNWVSYRSACESLKHEKYLYLAKAPPYNDARDPHGLLAERVELLVSQEQVKWFAIRQREYEVKGGSATAGQPKT